MDYYKIKQNCDFHRKERYIEGISIEFCDMRHINRSTRYPDFFPTNELCDKKQCPIVKLFNKILK